MGDDRAARHDQFRAAAKRHVMRRYDNRFVRMTQGFRERLQVFDRLVDAGHARHQLGRIEIRADGEASAVVADDQRLDLRLAKHVQRLPAGSDQIGRDAVVPGLESPKQRAIAHVVN